MTKKLLQVQEHSCSAENLRPHEDAISRWEDEGGGLGPTEDAEILKFSDPYEKTE